MPAWVLRLAWAVRGKQLVRLHLKDDWPSVEGVLVGRWAGHYHLIRPAVIEGTGATVSLEGRSLEVPTGNVIFKQVLQ